MSYTVPQFVLAWTVPAGTVTLTMSDTSTIVCNVATATRYSSRNHGTAADSALAYLASEIAADDTGSSDWVASEVTGPPYGLPRLTNATRTDGLTVDSIGFGGGLSGDSARGKFGYSANTIGASGTNFDGAWTRYGLWIPHNVDEVLQSRNPSMPEDDLVITQSPKGGVTAINLGRLTSRTIEIQSVEAASVWPFYLEQTAFAAVTGHATADPHAALEQWRQAFVDDALQTFRYYPDYGAVTTSDYVTLTPGTAQAWRGRLAEALEEEGPAPLRYTVRLGGLES